MQSVRGRRVAMIFQNAMSALNPVQTAGEQVAETLRLHTSLAGDALRQRVVQLFAEVGIPDAQQRYELLSAPVVRRAAAARDDRDGAGLPA